jgi:hypothetical protein
MTEQRELIDNPHRSWVLSEDARRAGLAGVREARAALQSAARRSAEARSGFDATRDDERHRSAA